MTTLSDKKRIAELEERNQYLEEKLNEAFTQISWLMTLVEEGIPGVVKRGQEAEATVEALQKELKNRDQMLPVKTLFSSIELAPDATEAEKEAYERDVQNGTLQMDNTLVGMVVFFRQYQTKAVGHRIDGLVFQGNPDEAF